MKNTQKLRDWIFIITLPLMFMSGVVGSSLYRHIGLSSEVAILLFLGLPIIPLAWAAYYNIFPPDGTQDGQRDQ